jgi:brefeldin A-resistance guanine nucleotide exchange factor 1
MLRYIVPQDAPSIERLRRQKDRKALLITGAQAFNTKPKKGVAYLQEHSLIDGYKPGKENEKENVKALAVFLRSNGRLDKKLLGEYISNPDNLDLLKAYIGLFDFKGVSVARLAHEDCSDPILPFSEIHRGSHARTTGSFPFAR